MNEKPTNSPWPHMVLGLNDGLIELTGALVGFSIALQNPRLVSLTGLITGIAASLSMAASSFMHARQEAGENAKRAGLYTGISYLGVVVLLVSPFFFVSNVFHALSVMAVVALVIIACMSRYSARHLGRSFRREFGITLLLSLGVAIISFGIASLLKVWIGVEL